MTATTQTGQVGMLLHFSLFSHVACNINVGKALLVSSGIVLLKKYEECIISLYLKDLGGHNIDH